MERDVQDSNRTTRYRAEIILPTGKVIVLNSDWKQSHWQEVEDQKRSLIRAAKERAEAIRKEYGIECDEIRIFEENRLSVRVVETTRTRKLYSTINLAKES